MTEAEASGARNSSWIFVDPESSEASAPLESISEGRLELWGCASRVKIHGDRLERELFRAHFEGSPPQVRVRGGTVRLGQERSLGGWLRQLLDFERRESSVLLNASIPWEVVIKGGAYALTADLSAVPLRELSVTGGANAFELTLPRPKGVVHVRLYGGANAFRIRRPAGVGVGLRIVGGVSALRLDAQILEAAGGMVCVQTSDFSSDPDRYEVELLGGASDLAVTTLEDRLAAVRN